MLAYLKSDTPHLNASLAALAATGLPGTVYVPGAVEPQRQGALDVTTAPIDLASELSSEVLFATNGGLASVGLAWQRGAQLLLFPQQVEQVAMLRRLILLQGGSGMRLGELGGTAAESWVLKMIQVDATRLSQREVV